VAEWAAQALFYLMIVSLSSPDWPIGEDGERGEGRRSSSSLRPLTFSAFFALSPLLVFETVINGGSF
jgi:hypothetical protein